MLSLRCLWFSIFLIFLFSYKFLMHQQDAVDTAKMFDDMRSLGIYLRLFKKYHRERLIQCREWVDKNGNGNKGRLFVSVHKKFI